MAKKALLFSIVFLVVTYQPFAHALAIHELVLKSSINQQLNAVIALTASEEELNSLHLIIERAEAGDSSSNWPKVQAELVRIDKGNSYIVLTSEDVIREPILEFVLGLDWSNGRILREYSLIIDL